VGSNWRRKNRSDGNSVEMINENRNVSEESSIMQRSYADVAWLSGCSIPQYVNFILTW